MAHTSIVLLHGAGTGGWVWDRLTPHLVTPSIAPDLPRSPDITPNSCAFELLGEIDRSGASKVILVMHSLAGVLAPELSILLKSRLLACIYVAAVVPAHKTTFARTLGFPARYVLPVLFRLNPKGLKPSVKMIRNELCNDLSKADTERVIDRYQAEYRGLFLTPVNAPPQCPSAYVMLNQDRSVHPSQQADMIKRISDPSVIEIDAGHLVMLSKPKELATAIEAFCKTIS